MYGYCKLLGTDVKRNAKIIRNQNEQLLLFLSMREGQVYRERVNPLMSGGNKKATHT